ncbi:hypothetical protein [Gaoshiqia sediminis]|uniref:Uncharacterized protein n=1 Tax=Gaoshiqia sediminis TaxID=2986998 RepID=A0AA41Y6Y8_9BACT|nr:hypothetical protein [Gaoshiqia sediminis]MCW0484559.1 hypothetical protein [Gaoshiqia sediminis]
MIQPKLTPIPAEIVGQLTPFLVSSVTDIVDVSIERSQTGALYLLIPFQEPNENQTILVEISEERANAIRNRAMPLIFPFMNPEKKLFYLAEMNSDKQIAKLFVLSPEQKLFEWPLPKEYTFNLNFVEKRPPSRLMEFARKRNRVVIEMIFEADDLQENIRVYAFRNVLLPFVELIKTAILSGSLYVNDNNLEAKLKLGLSRIEHKCFLSQLEFKLSNNLLEDNLMLGRVANLYLMLDAENQDEFLELANSYENKKIVLDISKILRAVISNKGTLKSQMASPEKEYQKILLTRGRARMQKKWLDTANTAQPYIIKVAGCLTRLDFEAQRAPLFTLHAADNEKYIGKIASALVQKMDENQYNFRNTNYVCQLEVKYTPESLKNDERYNYTLLDIEEAELDSQTSLDEVEEN